MNKYFMTPGEYDKFLKKDNDESLKKNGMSEFFKPAIEFEDINKKEVNIEKVESKDLSRENVEKYLSSIVSGKKYPFRSEVGIIVTDSDRFVKLEELIDMVNSGKYNIVSASYINNEIVQVHFQEIANDYDDELKRGF